MGTQDKGPAQVQGLAERVASFPVNENTALVHRKNTHMRVKLLLSADWRPPVHTKSAREGGTQKSLGLKHAKTLGQVVYLTPRPVLLHMRDVLSSATLLSGISAGEAVGGGARDIDNAASSSATGQHLVWVSR